MKKTITILIPLFNESKNIIELHSELEKTVSELRDYLFTYLFVDDGSSDDSFQMIEKLALKDGKIKALELSRNFGKEIAVTAGIDSVNSDALIIMDADLQHPPQMIPKFIRKWEEGYEIIATRRTEIQNRAILKKLGSTLFYTIINKISDTEMINQTTDFRLIDKKVVKELKRFTERNRMVRGLIDWMGFKKTVLEFKAPDREEGEAGYGYRKLIRLAIDSLTSFSLLPLKIAGYLGLLICLVFGSCFILMIIDHFTINYGNFSTLAYVIVINSFLIGVVLTCLGLIALYIGHITTEVLNRPIYIVRNKINLQ
jgi:polyisoprenyl-phosphate glycosyltransferase